MQHCNDREALAVKHLKWLGALSFQIVPLFVASYDPIFSVKHLRLFIYLFIWCGEE